MTLTNYFLEKPCANGKQAHPFRKNQPFKVVNLQPLLVALITHIPYKRVAFEFIIKHDTEDYSDYCLPIFFFGIGVRSHNRKALARGRVV